MITYQYLILSDGDTHPDNLKEFKSKYKICNPQEWKVRELCKKLVVSEHKNITEFPIKIELYRNDISKGVFDCGLMIDFEAEKVARHS